jgi:phospholipase/carboxylesterase
MSHGVELIVMKMRIVSAFCWLMVGGFLAGQVAAQVTPRSEVPWGGLKHSTAGVSLKKAELIIVMLHGYGSSGDDLAGLARVIDPEQRTAFVFPVGPVSLGFGGRAWSKGDGEGFENSRRQVLDLLVFLHEKNKDAAIVVGGFSQGATLVSNILDEKMTSVAAILLYSPSGFLNHPARSGDDLPAIFLSHGREDEVLPFSGSVKVREGLLASGYTVDWQAFAGGHAIPPEVIEATNDFLEEHIAGETP